MGFFERLEKEYRLEMDDGSLNRCVPGYMRLQREVINAHILAHRTCFPESKISDDDLALSYVTMRFPCGKTFSEDYREAILEIFSNPDGELASRCEEDWDNQMKQCLYFHDAERHSPCPVLRELDLKRDFIAGRVIYNRLIEREGVTETHRLPGLVNKVA